MDEDYENEGGEEEQDETWGGQAPHDSCGAGGTPASTGEQTSGDAGGSWWDRAKGWLAGQTKAGEALQKHKEDVEHAQNYAD